MLILHQFQRTWGIPNLSPFCCKIETYLRMADIDYEIRPTLPSRAPKGKLPYIDDDGVKLADSRFIISHLKSTYKDLDNELTHSESAISIAMQRLLEEHLFWIALYSRWQYTDDNWKINKQAIFGGLPPVIRDMVANRWRQKIKQQIFGHGTGRHRPEEIFALGQHDIDALSAHLGNQPYFLGDQPTALDASAFGLLINIIGCPIESPLKDFGLSKTNLVDYVARVGQEFYPELQAL